MKILVFYHCGSNTGYAIEKLEHIFLSMAIKVTGGIQNVHIGYNDMKGGRPTYLPKDFDNLVVIDSKSADKKDLKRIYEYIRKHQITIAFGFDQPVSATAYKAMRKAGIRLFVSYWGAPMSSLNKGLKLAAKRFEVLLTPYKPDHFIFESEAMAQTATKGRGVRSSATSVIPLGVDTEKFKPRSIYADYAYKEFGIPQNRKIIFYSGHMEERKGVHIILQSANELILNKNRTDIHFLILGNKNGDELRFDRLYKNRDSKNYITFGGYKKDIDKIMASCYVGVIPSTGWESFTMSSVEMASSGLPLIVSELQGAKETIQPGVTGILFSPGDYMDLARKIEYLLNNPSSHESMCVAARQRVLARFSKETQIENLVTKLNSLKPEPPSF